MEDLRVFVAFRDDVTDSAALKAGQGVIDEQVRAGNVRDEVDDRRTAGSDSRGLNVEEGGVAERRLVPDAVSDVADDVERRRQVGAADAVVDADAFADTDFHRVLFRERADGAVHQHVLG